MGGNLLTVGFDGAAIAVRADAEKGAGPALGACHPYDPCNTALLPLW